MLAWLWTRLSEGGARVAISGRALSRFPANDVERLLRAQVLIEEQKADTWSVCAECDCGLDARPVEWSGEVFRAFCPHDQSEDVILQKDDLRRFSIDVDRLVVRIAASGDFGGAVARISASRLKELVVTDTILPTEAMRVAKNIRVISIAPLIGEAIARTAKEESVSSLFD